MTSDSRGWFDSVGSGYNNVGAIPWLIVYLRDECEFWVKDTIIAKVTLCHSLEKVDQDKG